LKSDLFEFLNNARKRRPEKFRTQFYILVICLGISIFLWWLVKLSRDYSYNVEYNLHYVHTPANLRLVDFSDSLVTVTIKVQGFEFFSDYFFRKQYHEFDVSLQGIKVKPSGDQMTGYMLSRNISRQIASESKYPLDIFSTTPDTLFFIFEKKNLKKSLPYKAGSTSGNKADSDRKPTDTLTLHMLPSGHVKYGKQRHN
jgi:hypothetical protein